MKKIRAIVCILLALIPVFMGVRLSHGETEPPVTMTIEPDPECQLTGPGELTYLRFTLKNTSNDSYTLHNAVLSGELLPQSMAFEEDLTLEGKGVLEFRAQKLSVPLDAFDRDLTFRLSWLEQSYGELVPDEEAALTYVKKYVTATVRIERFDEPKLSLSYKLTQTMAASGTQVQVTYLLKNDTKFDMTGLSLYDSGVSSSYIPLPQEQLLAGTSMEVPYTFTMGEVDAVINPVVEYTVKGEKQLASCESSATITYVKVELTLSVQQYPATESGTLFALTVTNTGTHAMTDICLYDEIGTELEEPFDLSAGQSRSITYTVAAAVAASTPRRVSFQIQAKDFQGQPYTAESKDSYEIKPYVEADQVNLQLIVTLSNSKFNDDGSLTATILFEMRNYSAVPITKGVLTENNAFNGVVIQYDQLNTGVTTFSKEFNITEGNSILSFVLTAEDPAGTAYATDAMRLDLTGLLQRRQEGGGSANKGTTIDTTGTIYDTAKFTRIFRRSLLVLFLLIVALLAASAILYVYEQSIRRSLPFEEFAVPTPGKTSSEEKTADTARLQFGYVRPAKLRYMEQERSQEAQEEPAPVSGRIPLDGDKAFRRPSASTANDSDTSAFKRPERPNHMLTEEKTTVFPAITPAQAANAGKKADPPTADTGVPEGSLAGNTLTSAAKSTFVPVEPEPIRVFNSQLSKIKSDERENAFDETDFAGDVQPVAAHVEPEPVRTLNSMHSAVESSAKKSAFEEESHSGALPEAMSDTVSQAEKQVTSSAPTGTRIFFPRRLELRPQPKHRPRKEGKPLRIGSNIKED